MIHIIPMPPQKEEFRSEVLCEFHYSMPKAEDYEVKGTDFTFLGVENKRYRMFFDERMGLFKQVYYPSNLGTTPNTIKYFRHGTIRELFRPDDGPTIIQTTHRSLRISWAYGQVAEMDSRELLHRDDDQPALIETFEGEERSPYYEYYKNGEIHRLKGPARLRTQYTDKGQPYTLKNWFVNGQEIDTMKYPVVDEGKLHFHRPIDRAILLEATLFDREYGNYLLKLFKETSG